MRTPRIVIDDDGDRLITWSPHRATPENPAVGIKLFTLVVLVCVPLVVGISMLLTWGIDQIA